MICGKAEDTRHLPSYSIPQRPSPCDKAKRHLALLHSISDGRAAASYAPFVCLKSPFSLKAVDGPAEETIQEGPSHVSRAFKNPGPQALRLLLTVFRMNGFRKYRAGAKQRREERGGWGVGGGGADIKVSRSQKALRL